MLMTIVINIISVVNNFLSRFLCLKIPLIGRPFKFLTKWIHCISISGGLTEDEEENVEYFPGCKKGCGHIRECETKGCKIETSTRTLIDKVQQTLSQEYDIVNLDFYNDWVNGCLYLPLWFWKKKKKKKYFFGLFSKRAVNTYCSCSKQYSRLHLSQTCSLRYDKNNYDFIPSKGDEYHNLTPMNAVHLHYGVIKEFKNKDNLNIYYYAPGLPTSATYKTDINNSPYARLFSTDIILLGSLYY